MMERMELHASARSACGSSAMRRLRRAGQIPGVVYGHGMAPLHVQVEAKAMARVLHSKGGENTVLTLLIANEGSPDSKTVLVKDVQHSATTDAPTHIDFLTISLTEKIRINTPIEAHGEAIGVKRDQGVLDQQLWELDIECLPTAIPEKIEVSVESLEIGHAIHVRDLTIPSGIEVFSDLDGVVVTVMPPRLEEEPEAAEAAEGEEPELIAKGKEEAAAEGGEADERAPAESAPKE